MPAIQEAPQSQISFREQIELTRPFVGLVEVHGPLSGSVVRQESAFLISPTLAVTSAFGLASGSGITMKVGAVQRSGKLCGVDLMHDLALIEFAEPFEVEGGLTIKSANLIGNERLAVVGKTVLMEDIGGVCSLTGATAIQPMLPIAQVQNLTQKGLAGSPLIDERGWVAGMLSARIFEESGTRLVIPGSAIALMACTATEGSDQRLIPGIPDNVDSDEYAAWAEQEHGLDLLLTGHTDRALEQLAQANTDRGQMWLAIAYMVAGRHVEALDVTKALAKLKPNSAEVHYIAGHAHFKLRELRQAATEWQLARSLEDKWVLPTLALARLYPQIDRGQESIKLLKQALRSSPDYLPTLLLAGQIMNDRLRYPEARNYYNQILELDPRNPMAWSGLGRTYLARKQSAKAKNCFEEALRIQPDLFEARMGLCQVALKKRNWDLTLELCIPLRKDYPEHVGLLLVHARATARSGEHEEARDLYEEATFIDPNSVDSHLGLGLTYKELMKYDRAIMAFDECLRVEPNHSGALFSAGVCHLMLGDRGAARNRHKALHRVDRAAAERLFKMIYNK